MASSGRVDTDLLVPQLKANGWQWGAPKFVPSIDSTNQALLAALPDEGACLIAGEQTSGRGRGANTWLAPADSALLLSVALRPKTPPESWPWAGVLLALATRDAVQGLLNGGFEAALKWPNDIMVREPNLDGKSSRKIGGVLSQSAQQVCVVGVGLNVYQSLDEMNKIESAVSLSMVTRKKVPITDLAAHLLSNFHDAYFQWQSQWLTVGNEEVRQRYLKSCETLGINVNFKRGGELLSGYARDVDPQGQLLVELPNGEIMELTSDTAIEVRSA